MLYVTTRSNKDAFTAQRVRTEKRGPDGGHYLPFKAPYFSPDDIDALRNESFNQCVAEILNLLFNTKLSSWDIDFCVGRYPVRTEMLGHRIVMAESWHNPDGNFERMVTDLTSCLHAEAGASEGWIRIAIRIAVLFGLFSDLKKYGIDSADVCTVSGDFSAPISAWYARQWGLPISNIICTCNENHNLWNLFNYGQMRTDNLSIDTCIPAADVTVPDHLERLIYECGGISEVQHFLDCCRCGVQYCPDEQILAKLRQRLYVSVVSSQRIATVIPSVYGTHRYLMTSCAALAYAGLLDYRAKTGRMHHAVILTEESPACEASAISKTLRISEEELKHYM